MSAPTHPTNGHAEGPTASHTDGAAVPTRADATVLVQLTDLHIGAPGTHPYGTDTAANLRVVAHAVRESGLEPDAVLLTGDLSDRGDAASYELLRELVRDELEPLGAPVLPVVGNHDHRGTFRQAYLGEADGRDDDPYHYVCDLDRVRIVMCDSYLAGQVTGELGAAQLAWLDDQLASAGDRATIVALHHPSVPRGVPRPADYLLEDRAALGEVLERHDVAAVLCGHAHVSAVSHFGNTMHAVAPATAYQLDPTRGGGAARAYDACGYSVCTVRDGRAIVNAVRVEPTGSVLYEREAVVAGTR
ncbi:MAG: metallophosphoesterase [Actinomycetota bacterium]|nr:metallophosphoesterase [Actinomycetota bacterium]